MDVGRAVRIALLRLRSLAHRSAVESELDDELRDHVDRQIADLVERGMDPAEARTHALRALGGVESLKENVRDTRRVGVIEDVARDVAYGARVLTRSRAFTLVAALSLALGIGANTAIFQLLDALQLRALPIHDANELAIVQIRDRGIPPGGHGGSYGDLTNPQWELIRGRQQAFSHIFAWTNSSFDLSERGESSFAENSILVSGEYFATLGVAPALGRLLTPDDDVPGCGEPGVVLSHDFWRSRFGGDEAAVGSRIAINGRRLPVIGVTPRGFHGVEVGRSFNVAVPLCAEPIVHAGSGRLQTRNQWFLAVMGRLAAGWTLEQASAHLDALSPSIFQDTLPPTYAADRMQMYRDFRLMAREGKGGFSRMRETYDQPLWILLGLAGTVLLIACANLANLMLARVGARDREISVRLALGASRGRVVRQLLVESLMLAALGAAAGAWLAPVLAEAVVGMMSSGGDPLFLDLARGWRVFVFTAGLACGTTMLFGLAPALRGTRVTVDAALRRAGRTVAGGGRVGLRRALVVAQVALSLVLLVGGLLFARTLYNLTVVEAGFEREGILRVNIDMTRLNLSQDAVRSHRLRILDSLRAVPQVRAAASASAVPLVGVWSNPIYYEGKKSDFLASLNRVSPGYFATMGTPLLNGRDFYPTDTNDAARVAVVNEAFARRVFGGEHPIGKVFQIQDDGRPGPPVEVVGLVRNTAYRSLRDTSEPIVYLSHTQASFAVPYVQCLMRVSGSMESARAAVTRALDAHDIPLVFHFYDFGDQVGRSILRERLMAWLCGFFAVLAAALAVVGVYGVIAYSVQQRRAEIGVRLALGSSRGGILRLVLTEASGLVAAGVVLGLAIAWFAAGRTAPLLFGVRPWDPLVFAAAALLLAAVAGAATLVPAWRATRLDPRAILLSP